MSALVYAYGADAPLSGLQALQTEHERCTQLWDALVRIDHTLDAQMRASAAEDDPRLSAIAERIGVLNAALAAQPKDEAARTQRRELYREQRERLNAWRKTHKDAVRALELRRQVATKLARQQTNAYWGNYLRVLRSYETGRQVARQKGRLLRYHDELRDDGVMAVQIQRTASGLGAAPDELTDGTVAAVQLGRTCQPGRRSRLLQMRIDAAGSMVTLPVYWHRALPADGRVKWAQLTWRRVGTRTVWQLCLTLQRPSLPLRVSGAAAAQVSWHYDQGLTVLRAQCGTHTRTWSLSEQWQRRWQLVTLRTAALDGAVAQAHDRWPHLADYSILELFEHLQARWDCLKADQRAWLRTTRTAYNALTGLRCRLLRYRREQYRHMARELVRAYESIELTDIDLAKIAREERGEPINSARHALALHTLRAEIIHQASKIGLPVLASGKVVNEPRNAESNSWARAKTKKLEVSRIASPAVDISLRPETAL